MEIRSYSFLNLRYAEHRSMTNDASVVKGNAS